MQPDANPCLLTRAVDGDSGYTCLQIDSPLQTQDVAIIFLHGVGERGGHSEQILKYGLPATLWNRSHEINCRVVCPHLPLGETWNATRLSRLVASVRKHAPKIVLCGYSLGGAGACALLASGGELPNIVIIIAARFREAVVDRSLATRIIFVEGELDDWPDTISIRESFHRNLVRFEYVKLVGRNHFISEAAMEVAPVISAFESVGIRYRRLRPSRTLTK